MININSDMGEGFGIYKLSDDEALMPSSLKPMSPADSTHRIPTT